MTRRARRSRDWRGAELFGLLLVVAGIYWLLAETGWLVWLGWGFVWPLVLIGLGVLLVMSRMSAHGSESMSIPRDGATQLDLSLNFGGGRLRLTGGGKELIEAQSHASDIDSDVQRRGTAARVRLRQGHFPWSFGWGGADWRLQAASDLPTDLRVNGGAGELDLDLSAITTVRAAVSVGAASLRLVLPRPRGDVEIRVSTGAASVGIVVPSGVEAKVTNTGGLISVDGRTETPGYATASDRVSVHVTGGASSINIR